MSLWLKPTWTSGKNPKLSEYDTPFEFWHSVWKSFKKSRKMEKKNITSYVYSKQKIFEF